MWTDERQPPSHDDSESFAKEFYIKNSCKNSSSTKSSTFRNSKWYFNFSLGSPFENHGNSHTIRGGGKFLTCFWGYWKWKFLSSEFPPRELFFIIKNISTRFTMLLIFISVLAMPWRDKQAMMMKILWKLKTRRLVACLFPLLIFHLDLDSRFSFRFALFRLCSAMRCYIWIKSNLNVKRISFRRISFLWLMGAFT